MTNLMYAEALEKDVEYSIKFNFEGRKKRVDFVKITRSYSSETEYIMVYEFRAVRGGNYIKVTDEHIESIELSKPLKPKQKKGVTCNRCLGNKTFEKFSHVNGGKCFKCEGTGTV